MKYIIFLMLFPILSCSQQEYTSKPYNEYEGILRNSPIDDDKAIVIITSDWEEMDSLSYLRFKNLKHLIIDEDVINIPNWIFKFKNLETLDINHSIPEKISEFKKLKHLNGQNLSKKEVSIEICELKELTFLNLTGNNLENIPPCLEKLKKLETIRINSPHLINFPKFITTLPNLKEINISATNISAIPENIGNLKKLEKLDISNTKINNIPNTLFENNNLKEISISNTPISENQRIKIHEFLKQNRVESKKINNHSQ